MRSPITTYKRIVIAHSHRASSRGWIVLLTTNLPFTSPSFFVSLLCCKARLCLLAVCLLGRLGVLKQISAKKRLKVCYLLAFSRLSYIIGVKFAQTEVKQL